MEAFTMFRLLRLLFVIAVVTGRHHPSTKVSPLPSDQPDDHLVNRPGGVSAGCSPNLPCTGDSPPVVGSPSSPPLSPTLSSASRPRRQTFMIVGLRNSRSNVNKSLDVTDGIVERELEVMCRTVTCMRAFPKKGDIIRFPRGVYSHYGIYIGNGEVIHRSGDPDGPSMTSASSLSFSGVKSSKASIRVDKLEDIVGNGLEAQISNYLDNYITPYSTEEIVKRAESELGKKGYNILFKNCEHFVTWCRYGKEISQQVERFFPSSSLVTLELIHGNCSCHAEWNKSYQYERSTRQRCPASI